MVLLIMSNVLVIKYVSGIDKHRVTTSRLNVYNSNWVRMQKNNEYFPLSERIVNLGS